MFKKRTRPASVRDKRPGTDLVGNDAHDEGEDTVEKEEEEEELGCVRYHCIIEH